MSKIKLTAVEHIKDKSNYLRGSLNDSLADDLTGSLRDDDLQLIKFHGSYQQDDRDIRSRRIKKKLEPAYSFMIRLRIPAGKISSKQMLEMFNITDLNATGIVKITTRQTVQLHGVVKAKLKPTIKFFDKYNLDSIAACGDVNRNIMTTSNFAPNDQSLTQYHQELVDFTHKLSEKFLPQAGAYQEIWLDGEKILEKTDNPEPIYGKHYLPRKFKMAIALPPYNDVDVFAHDLGLIAIIENNKLIGFNVLAGGGMGRTHGNEATYPRVGSLIGFVAINDILDIAEAIITFQRDYGNRSDRKLSRLKYTIDKLGLKFFRQDIEKRSNIKISKAKDFEFKYRNDQLGFWQDIKGLWHYTVFVENGRILDYENVKLKSALIEIAKANFADFIFTANQNVTLANITPTNKVNLEAILVRYEIDSYQESITKIRSNAMACVALNTCPLALAEGQRYLPSLISKIETKLDKYDLIDEDITIRMTGCPNGCARPYLAEIAFVGTDPGRYNMHIGADRYGSRLNKQYKDSLNEDEILDELDNLFELYSKNQQFENFSDFAYEHILKQEYV